MGAHAEIYMQYGCGFCAPQDWLNFDASPTLRFERIPLLGRLYARNGRRFPENVRYGDIVRGLPVSLESCRGIYCSHVLEHLTYHELRAALRNTYSYLSPGGTFRMVLPDLETLTRSYLADPSEHAAYRLMEAMDLGRKHKPRSLAGLAAEWLGHSAHQWMWDEKSLTYELRDAGFVTIRRAQFNDCADTRFLAVEEQGRFEGCLALECSSTGGRRARS